MDFAHLDIQLSTGEAATLRWIKKQRGNAFDDDEDDFEEGDDDFVGVRVIYINSNYI